MVPVLRPVWAFFFHQKSPLRPCTGTKKRSGQRVPPPLGPCLQRGSKAALGFAPPPLAARLRWPGTPAPGQHQPHLMFGGQVWPPLARPPRCSRGGRCGGLLDVNNSQQRNREEAAALWPGPGGEAAVRFRQPMGPARCAHWPGRELAPCGLTPWPRPGLLPPLPPRWGGPGPDMCVRENTARAASVLHSEVCHAGKTRWKSGKGAGVAGDTREQNNKNLVANVTDLQENCCKCALMGLHCRKPV